MEADRPVRSPNRDDAGEAFLRGLVVPEEDRHLFTTVPWRGEFRWFRSPNIVPIERARRRFRTRGGGTDYSDR
jgi:hypothetical protein